MSYSSDTLTCGPDHNGIHSADIPAQSESFPSSARRCARGSPTNSRSSSPVAPPRSTPPAGESPPLRSQYLARAATFLSVAQSMAHSSTTRSLVASSSYLSQRVPSLQEGTQALVCLFNAASRSSIRSVFSPAFGPGSPGPFSESAHFPRRRPGHVQCFSLRQPGRTPSLLHHAAAAVRACKRPPPLGPFKFSSPPLGLRLWSNASRALTSPRHQRQSPQAARASSRTSSVAQTPVCPRCRYHGRLCQPPPPSSRNSESRTPPSTLLSSPPTPHLNSLVPCNSTPPHTRARLRSGAVLQQAPQ